VRSAQADAEFLAHTMGATLRGATTVELLFGGSPIIERGFLAAERAHHADRARHPDHLGQRAHGLQVRQGERKSKG
jgi:hypothetical protein